MVYRHTRQIHSVSVIAREFHRKKKHSEILMMFYTCIICKKLLLYINILLIIKGFFLMKEKLGLKKSDAVKQEKSCLTD